MSIRKIVICSFCGKPQTEVAKVIVGPGVHICNICVNVCANIMIKAGVTLDACSSNLTIDLNELGVKPRFKKLKFDLRPKHIFYACPFRDPFDVIYKDHVKKVCLEMGLPIERADEVFGDQPIIEDIWESINSCQVMIADVTGKNPNVMYEIGMAHTVGKPVIMSQRVKDIPFDLRHYRCILYSYTPRGCAELEIKLKSTVQFLVENRSN